MKDKLTLRDYMIYIIPGYIWLSTIYLAINLFSNFQEALITFNKYILNGNTFSIGYIIISIPLAYVVGHFFIIISDKLNKYFPFLFLGDSTKIKYDENLHQELVNKFEFRINHKRFNDRLEYLVDDMLAIKGIRNSWSKYHDLAHLMKHLFSSGFFFSILLLINALKYGDIAVFIFFLVLTLTGLYFTRLRYMKMMKNYFTEIQLSFLISEELGKKNN